MEKPRLVFIADDDPADLYALTRVFSARGWRVETFVDGEYLLARVKRFGCEADLIICDINMPVLGALELVPLLKPYLPNTARMVILSSSLTPELKDQFGDMKVTDVYQKPFGVPALTQFVDKLTRSFEDPL